MECGLKMRKKAVFDIFLFESSMISRSKTDEILGLKDNRKLLKCFGETKVIMA